ncbi:carboxypeptidase B [Tribolium castaneum]|uniref:Zinc carboxypeptidase A 1 n=1 Tax=Tribolium castaneum TaxID=7070 RepID=D6WIV6_TRICA|nr:PREDICTED: carboxypeptidase B [Tribolium castaneum]EFA01360.1 carboxypeptidase A [Tribolium castaneum]|eukprot:XP_968597.1 PREDICTED: carboxypeptidase B [Tribolium castaneum]
MRVVIVTLLAFLGLTTGTSYEGFKVYKVLPKTELQNAYLQELESSPDFDFWSKLNKVGAPVVIMVAPNVQKAFESYLTRHEIEFELTIENVERTIQAEKSYHTTRQARKSTGITFDHYLRHDEINAYLTQLAQTNPSLVTVETIGQSYQNRSMNLIRISSGTTNPPKPVIFIDAGIHAREWIAPALALYVINQLVENPENSNLSKDIDWIILPSVNPDGYEYTWTTNRLWRKTISPGLVCDGCDANRNFDFHWMESGASNWECSDTYAGKKAFSEIETQNLKNYLLKTPNIEAYITLHSYGQYLLYPWGYIDKLCDNWKELDQLGHDMDKAISAVNGTTYTIGGSTATLYAAAGASDDWSMGVRNVSIVYTWELPGGGTYGFDLPPERIEGVVKESFEGVKVLANFVAKNRK